jgi:GT2 family glycosyltransferase
MIPTPRVSVIIPCFNGGRYLSEAIESVLGQTLREYEIVLVDDGSTDDTPLVAARYCSVLTAIRQGNMGPSVARNRGLQVARAPYIVFLDADDILLPRKLELQATFLEEHPEIDVVYSDGYRFTVGANGLETRSSLTEDGFLDKELGPPSRNGPVLSLRNAFPIHAAMARSQCLKQAGGFDEELRALEDWDLWYRIGSRSIFAYVDAVVAGYRVSREGISHDSSRQRVASEQIRRKIMSSSSFASLTAASRSDFYYTWSVEALRAGRPLAGGAKLVKAVVLRPSLQIWAGRLNSVLRIERKGRLHWRV